MNTNPKPIDHLLSIASTFGPSPTELRETLDAKLSALPVDELKKLKSELDTPERKKSMLEAPRPTPASMLYGVLQETIFRREEPTTPPAPTYTEPQRWQAKRDIEFMTGNAEFQSRLHAHNPAVRKLAIEEWTLAHEIAYADEPKESPITGIYP